MSDQCLICQQEMTWQKVFDTPDNTLKETYTILECPHCQIKKTSPVPEDLSKFYPVTYFDKPQNRIFYYAKGILIDYELKRIRRFTKAKAFLDIGAGWGDFSLKAYLDGNSVVAADNSPLRPYYLRDYPEIPYIHFNYEPLNIAEPQHIKNKIVVLRHVLEHVRDPRAFLNFFVSHQADYFYIVIPNASCLERKVFRQYDSFWYPPYHLWHFNKNSLKTLLENLGLNIVTMGFDTIPTILPHVYFYMRAKKYPQFIINLLEPTGGKVALTIPLNLFFPNNVLWAIAKIKKAEN